MRCLDMESRAHLIPLPTVLQRIVASYLSNDLIPTSVQSISPFHRVIAIDGQDIYFQHDKKIYKNGVAIAPIFDSSCSLVPESDRLCAFVPLKYDWLLINGHLYNSRTKQMNVTPSHSSDMVCIKGKIFYVNHSLVFEAVAPNYSPKLVKKYVQAVECIGECLNLYSYPRERLRLYDDPRIWRCIAVYRWQNTIYQIKADRIEDEDNHTVFSFPHIDTFVNAQAIQELLFVSLQNHLYMMNLNQMTFMECLERDIRVVNGRLFRVCNDELIVYH